MRAVASPIPLEAPVMTTTWSRNLFGFHLRLINAIGPSLNLDLGLQRPRHGPFDSLALARGSPVEVESADHTQDYTTIEVRNSYVSMSIPGQFS